ncbi:MAG: hypothetical protein AAFX99_36250 [Myxococcota bacterium]
MNVSTPTFWIAVAVSAVALSGCDSTPEAKGKEAPSQSKAAQDAPNTKANPEKTPTKGADKATQDPAKATQGPNTVAKGTDTATPTPTQDSTPSSADPVPLGAKGAIFMVDGGKAKLLDATGKELSSFATNAGVGMTFYDPLKARVFVHSGGTLHTVDLNSKKTASFAQLPKTALCKTSSKLDVVSSWGLGLTSGGKALCVRTQDGPESKVKVAITHQIDTSNAAITSKVVADYERTCKERANEEFCTPDFELSYPHKEPSKDLQGIEVDRYGCTVKKEGKTIKIKRPKGAKGWCDLALEGFTPSRRFMGVTTLLNEDDATRVFDLIDLKTGKVLSKFRTTSTAETLSLVVVGLSPYWM